MTSNNRQIKILRNLKNCKEDILCGSRIFIKKMKLGELNEIRNNTKFVNDAVVSFVSVRESRLQLLTSSWSFTHLRLNENEMSVMFVMSVSFYMEFYRKIITSKFDVIFKRAILLAHFVISAK